MPESDDKVATAGRSVDGGPVIRGVKKVFTFVMYCNLVLAAVSAFAITLAAISISYGVFVRNVLGQSTIWELEAGIYLILYATFLGAAYTHVAGGQIGINALRNYLKGDWKRYHKIFVDCVALALFVLIVYSGWSDMWTALVRGWSSDTIWGPPLWIPMLSIPLGASMLVATLVFDIFLTAAGHEFRPLGHSGPTY